MDFVYPKANNVTHITINSATNSVDYPAYANSVSSSVYTIDDGTQVAITRENVGYDCAWSEAKVIDQRYILSEFYNKKIYILSSCLQNVGSKESYLPICNSDNNIDINAPEIDISLKEIFIPYIDRRNGLYSVRIQIDQDRIIDSIFFENVLQEVYLEGVNVLLSSRGFLSDNDTINELKNKYYTFAYINKDFDSVIPRNCEPLTFTVSMPINFFNSIPLKKQETDTPPDTSDITLSFTNKDFISNINTILQILNSRAADIKQLTYPNSFIKGFSLEIDNLAIRKFATATSDLMEIAGIPIKTIGTDIITEYQIGLSADYDIVFIKAFIYGPDETIEVVFNQSMLAQCRLRAEFNNKRIFNYLLNIKSMSDDVNKLEILQFLQKYVSYPNAQLAEDSIILNGEVIPAQKVKEFKINFAKQSEACLKVSDIKESLESITSFSDTFYTLFIQDQEKISVRDSLATLRANFDSIQKEMQNYSTTGSHEIKVQIKDGATDALEYIKQEYSININTLGIILSKLNAKQLLFEQFFCLLKGLDPNDRETATIISQIPDDIINYYNYLTTIQGLTGKEYIKALERGIGVDYKLICSENQSLSYFIKGLKNLSNVLNTASNFGKQYISFANSLANTTQVTNPYQGLVKNIIISTEQLAVQFVLEYIKDVLTKQCDDPILERNYDNFSDPFATHTPLDRFNSTENNNPEIVKINRKDAVSYVYPDIINILQYGPDVEYTVNLIDSLLKDVNCILAPMESVQLLNGKPSDTVRALVKNIIRGKYFKDPNNLSFLLENDKKLDLFFERLGLTIDRDVLVQVEKIVTNVKEPSTLCSPQVLETRKQILQNKFPKDLGILEDQLQKRKKQARKVLDRIKGGDVVFDYSVLCPDVSNSDIDSVKDNIIKQYDDYIRNTFGNVLNEFTKESNNIVNKYTEPQQIQRKDGSTIFDVLDYNNYNSTLYRNLSSYEDNSKIKNINGPYTAKIKYFPYSSQEQSSQDLFSSLVANKEQFETAIVCPEGAFNAEQKFIDFIKDLNLLYDRVLLDEIFDDNGFDKQKAQGDLSDFKDPDEDLNTTLGRFLNSKKYFIAIEVNTEVAGDNYVYIKFVYNDAANNKFRILEQIDIPNPDDRISDDLKKNQSEYTKFLKESNTPDTPVYALREENFNKLSDETKNILQAAYKKFYDEYVGKIENYERNSVTLNLFKDSGLFNINRQLSEEENLINTKVTITTQDYNSNSKTLQPIESDYYPVINSFHEKEFVTNIVKTFDISYGLAVLGFPYFNSIFINYDKKDTYTRMVSYIYSRIVRRIGAKELDITDTEFSNIKIDKRQLYLKDFYNENEWRINFSDWGLEDSFSDKLSKKDAKFTRDAKYKDYWLTNYSTLSRFDYAQDIKYINCNIYPHYLNLDYYINLALGQAKTRLCDTNLPDVPKEILDEIIVNLTLRTYVTDLLVKSIPFLTLLDIDDLNSLENSTTTIDILRENIKNDMRLFSPTQSDPYLYYNYFIEKVKKVYNRYSDAGTLKDKFISKDTDLNKEINYFIRKETRHFIKYCLQKDIFVANKDKSFYKQLAKKYFFTADERATYENNLLELGYDTSEGFIKQFGLYSLENCVDETDNSQYDSCVEVYEFFDSSFKENPTLYRTLLIKNKYTEQLVKDEFYNAMSYFIMANTIDYNKRLIFHSTKKELADIFGKTLPVTDDESKTEFTNSDRSQEDIIKFITSLGSSPNPAALVLLKPEYSKYVTQYLDIIISAARSTLLTVAESQDLNILITRKYQFALATASALSWSLIDQETRNKLILDAPADELALFYKRLDEAKSPIPDFIASYALPGSGFPGLLGNAYLLLDLYDEYKWGQKKIEEIKALRGNKTPAEDPCEVPKDDIKNKVNEDLKCTPDKQKELKAKIDSFEEP